jgi:hypothetical protein
VASEARGIGRVCPGMIDFMTFLKTSPEMGYECSLGDGAAIYSHSTPQLYFGTCRDKIPWADIRHLGCLLCLHMTAVLNLTTPAKTERRRLREDDLMGQERCVGPRPCLHTYICMVVTLDDSSYSRPTSDGYLLITRVHDRKQ